MYAIVKTGGKQYRVEEGQHLLVEKLAADEGASVSLEPLLYRGENEILDGGDLAKVTVEARILGHERGPKLRIVKFKPKRGYKRRTGHRQDLTRIQITSIKAGAARRAAARAARASEAPEPVAAEPAAPEPAAPEPQEAENGAYEGTRLLP